MQAERMRILEMLQQGKITAEQASRLLEALEQSYQGEAQAGPGVPPADTAAPRPEGRRASLPGAVPFAGTDWARFGRNLAASITGRVSGALSGLGRIGAPDSKENFSKARFTRSFLSRLPDGTTYTNFGHVTILDDVPEDLLTAKIAQYHNFGRTEGPQHLIDLLQDRCPANFGVFSEPGDQSAESEEEAPPTASPAPAAQPHPVTGAETVLLSETPESPWKHLSVTCHAGSLDFTGADGDVLRLVAIAPSGGAAAEEASIPWSPAREADRLRITLGDPANPSATARMTFRFEVPVPLAVTAETAGGDISARATQGAYHLTTHGGNITCQNLEGDLSVESAGGNLSLSSIEGPVIANTGGGNVSCRDVEGPVKADTRGGEMEFADIEGTLQADTGGGNVKASGIEGSATISTGGGNITVSDVEGPLSASSGGGDLSVTDVEGAAALRTGGGGIKAADIEGDVTAETGAGDLHISDVEGTVTAKTGAGDIRVRDVTGDAFVETGSGQISLSGVEGQVHQRRG